MKISFLGTSSMMPTKERNPTSIFISYENEGILVDCGEGFQKNLRIMGISPNKITKLLITHWHGDHVLGIAGLLQSLAANSYSKTLEIYGPIGTKNYFRNMFRSFAFNLRINIVIKEIGTGKFFKNDKFSLEAFRLKHDIPCLGYVIKENDKRKINLKYLKKFGLRQHPIIGNLQRGKSIKWEGQKIDVNKATFLVGGRKISVVLDSEYFDKIIDHVKDSDLLICESTWLDQDKKYKHLSSKEAAMIAKKSKSKKLILTHFSQKYPDVRPLHREAKKVFNNVFCAHDLDEFSI